MVLWRKFLYLFVLSFNAKLLVSLQQDSNTEDYQQYLRTLSAPVPELIRSRGYRCDIHHVITEDGFVLELHRIAGGRQMSLDRSLIPVLLQHGLVESSSVWVTNDPSQGLGYLLADLGYDVWMGNARGNSYSKENIYINEDSLGFWNWTWNEMGYYDLPAVIDYMLLETGHEQIYYVGHSMGTTMFFVLETLRPEYNAKVRHMVALAPVAFLTFTTSPIRVLAPISTEIELFVDLLTEGEFLSRESFLDRFLLVLCSDSSQKNICAGILSFFGGLDPFILNTTLVPLIFRNYPDGTSIKTINHYAQVMKSGRFQQYSFIGGGNLIAYNSVQPPAYDLSKITTPMTLFYGLGDSVSTVLDNAHLSRLLTNRNQFIQVDSLTFNHIDFLFAKNAKELVYNKIIDIFQSN